jgi:protease I
MTELDGLKVAILANDMVEQVELIEPQAALEAAGAETEVLAPHDGELQAANHFDKADKIMVDKLIKDVSPDDYDAVLLPGGALNADHLRMDQDTQRFVQAMDRGRKPIAVICHAPWLLVSAGLVRGRSLASFYTIQDDITNAGGEWVDEEVVEDSNWVSSRQPDDIPAFNQAMIKLFAGVKSGSSAEA